ncbi:hypothetical protein ACFSOZ_26720 [Mesorhizobium newzealandense]|uniref:Uncharacterized protein n=1 Tax=Mesorhizobium newzealandense TaxID=1300302 RepID=A0ABW4UIY6_9HYPH
MAERSANRQIVRKPIRKLARTEIKTALGGADGIVDGQRGFFTFGVISSIAKRRLYRPPIEQDCEAARLGHFDHQLFQVAIAELCVMVFSDIFQSIRERDGSHRRVIIEHSPNSQHRISINIAGQSSHRLLP